MRAGNDAEHCLVFNVPPRQVRHLPVGGPRVRLRALRPPRVLRHGLRGAVHGRSDRVRAGRPQVPLLSPPRAVAHASVGRVTTHCGVTMHYGSVGRVTTHCA